MEPTLNSVELRVLQGCREGPSPTATSDPRTSAGPGGAAGGFENISYQPEEAELEVYLPRTRQFCPPPSQHQQVSPQSCDDDVEGRGGGGQQEGEGLTAFSQANDRSADYGFILALVFLVSGIVLVVIAYAVPREARVDPDSVSARQMEKLEMYYAQLGSHLDKCIIAGLGLLTLGGMFLSVLLMVSICRGETHRHGAAFVLPKRTYGSVSLRMKELASSDAGEGDGRNGGEQFQSNSQPETSWNLKSEPGPSRTRGAASTSATAYGV